MADPQRTLVAYDLETKSALWTMPLGLVELGRDTPTLIGDLVLAADRHDGEDKTEVKAIELATGKVRWSYATGRTTLSIEPGSDGTRVIFATENGSEKKPHQLVALQATSGTVALTLALDGAGGPVAVAHKRAFVRTKKGTVYAVNAADGRASWSVTLPAAAFATDHLVASDKRVYLIPEDGKVYALDATEKKYERPLERALGVGGSIAGREIGRTSHERGRWWPERRIRSSGRNTPRSSPYSTSRATCAGCTAMRTTAPGS
ncbi:PQQ-binding-like beta-propeller repeat protein [Polyangium sp. y55x31]|uniref:outer membrane protein assembly factor BamB family protein n=1 Tax=Polyangium sp. y55x31 TaxID=3042688 RepID=UPI0024823701|nr:PQQ-binding-like beta-propeller repeat protein [Polyangium sp. y55x31]MDI1480759.1 PQQ-binding-like beta-propeller repeat protein [Polyangium sp. y55x31]